VGLRPAVTDPVAHAKEPPQPADCRRGLRGAGRPGVRVEPVDVGRHPLRSATNADRDPPSSTSIVLFRQPLDPHRAQAPAGDPQPSSSSPACSGPPSSRGARRSHLFAQRFTRNSILGFEFPASWLQSVNSFFIWTLAPVFAWIWVALGAGNREPTSPSKFAYGCSLPAWDPGDGGGRRCRPGRREAGSPSVADPGLPLPHHRRALPEPGRASPR